jgi:hypothetical protein
MPKPIIFVFKSGSISKIASVNIIFIINYIICNYLHNKTPGTSRLAIIKKLPLSPSFAEKTIIFILTIRPCKIYNHIDYIH